MSSVECIKKNCAMNTTIDIGLKKSSNSKNDLKHSPFWPAINIEFQDIVYSVPDLLDNKVILNKLNGNFNSHQLTAIMGPSGAGKSTLLNILAGYKCSGALGKININNKPRDMKCFRKMSRYIMQQDVYQPMLTVNEAMEYCADLKLGKKLSKSDKNEVIIEILDLLRLTKARYTLGHNLSGGEKKRLSIALELINNPSVIFLDEPTTGLDDLSCSQCISLLQRLAYGGRTIICSIHTPSAKIFAMFDHIYILADGQCAYEGEGKSLVDYMNSIGLSCPLTYNPADFIIDVASGEYGKENVDKLVNNVKNGYCYNWRMEDHNLPTTSNTLTSSIDISDDLNNEIDLNYLKAKTTSWQQFEILYRRRTFQIFQNSAYLKLQIYMHLILGLVIGALFHNMGNDASKTIFNFGFCFTIIIFFMYIPMMPVLLEFPQEVQILKREHFNRYYGLVPYYFSMIAVKIPIQIVLGLIYVTIVYLITDQPLELDRLLRFYTTSILVSLVSQSFGMVIASRLSVVNGMFLGPITSVPIMLLAVYGVGFGKEVAVPQYVKILMSASYLRYGLEALISAIYGNNRADMICPEHEMFCILKKAKFLMTTMGFEEVSFTLSSFALCFFYVGFNLSAFYLIKRRLSLRMNNYITSQYIGRFVKRHLNFSTYK